MRPGMTQEIAAAVTAPKITTCLAARLEFASGPVHMWTGMMPITPVNSGDSLLDGQTFDPFVHGVVVEIGENTYSMQGSDELTIVLNIPADPEVAIAAAMAIPGEYQSRPAVVWRAIKIETGDPFAQPVWMFRRIRSGSMDKLEVQADGMSHKFIMTIESHSGRISNASQGTYLDQKKFDASDTSQDFAASIANGDPAPTKLSTANVFNRIGGVMNNIVG